MQSPTLIIDNGAHSIKALWSNSSDAPQVYRNAIMRGKNQRRNFVGDELDECTDFGGLVFRLPFERIHIVLQGILNNWEIEKIVWDRVFGPRGRGLAIDPSTTPLLMTEPVMNLPNVQDQYNQMIFEEYDFASYCRCPSPSVIPWGLDARGVETSPAPECVLVVDAGFSFTHAVPVLRGSVFREGVRRIDAGGKLLTNYLKEVVSFRQWYMMDQTYVIEHVKEKTCFVSQQFQTDSDTANSSASNEIVRTYVLPDFAPGSKNLLGYVRTGLTPPPSPPPVPATNGAGTPTASERKSAAAVTEPEPEQLLQMNNERFTIPEILFSPSTIDLNQAGIAETIKHAIFALPAELHGIFWRNIVCVGGSSAFPGFGERLETELRQLAPSEYKLKVTVSKEPTLAVALSAAKALTDPNSLFQTSFVTRAEYAESGSNICRKKFAKFYQNSSNWQIEA